MNGSRPGLFGEARPIYANRVKRLVLIVATATVVVLPTADASRGSGQLRVALVTYLQISPSQRDLGGVAYQGFLRAVRDFHVEGRVIKIGPAGAVAALALAARQKYDLIIAFIPDTLAIDKAARRFPTSRFLMVDVPVQALGRNRPANVAGGLFRVEQGGYLAGYLAALMEKRTSGRHVLGSVGGYSYSCCVDPFIAGFQAGARKADPQVTTLNQYSYSFVNPAKCRAAALAEIAKGAGAVFQVAGLCGTGVLEAAREKGVWGIGVDVDQSFLGPHILTSVIKRDDLAVYTGVRRLVEGTFRTGANTIFDVTDGGIGLGRINPKVPRSFLPRVETIRRAIIAGRIVVPERLSSRSGP
jgi:basic membrane protein A